MIGGSGSIFSVYFYPSIAAATAVSRVNWELLRCRKNIDDTLSCMGLGQSIFQALQDTILLAIGDQDFGTVVTLTLSPI